MMYQEFVTSVASELSALHPELKVEIKEVLKNNSTVKIGLMFSEEPLNISSVIYLESFFDSYESGVLSMKMVVSKVYELYESVKPNSSFDVSWFEFDNAKDKIIYSLVNRELNEKLLENIPYLPFLDDLAIIFSVFLSTEATVKITNDHLKYWGKTKEEIYAYAHANTVKFFPIKCKSILEAINSLFDNPMDEEKLFHDNEIDNNIYVLSNDKLMNGASVILYDGLLKTIAEVMKENFFILPSSLHEVLLIPESSSFMREELNLMVKDVNRTALNEEEILSDRAYFYDRRLGKIL